MPDLSKNGFHSPSKGRMTLGKIINEMSNFISEEPESLYSVVIGSDSQIKHNNGIKECDFITAIIIYRHGTGARYFWKKEKIMKAPILRDKIYYETMKSLDTAQELLPILKEYIPNSKYNFEIHIDVGSIGKTKEMLKEIVGMVNGNGFVAKTKPESWGASSVADKHT